MSSPSTSAASSQLPVGTTTRRYPASWIALNAGKIPGTGRSRPSSASSPICTQPATDSPEIAPVPVNTATAILTSNALPCFGTEAGERLMVVRWGGNENPELVMALRTRSLDSASAASGRPINTNAGSPVDTSASMSTI